jgi:hypothetical protein
VLASTLDVTANLFWRCVMHHAMAVPGHGRCVPDTPCHVSSYTNARCAKP